ncbi:anion exchange protein 3 isoform X2 [Hyalella azteca]|uniref:Anion exchange protein n=1 Tax=Hyalella azteca TaxID=294128 RepID=A0A979FH46_HYAAZ|nr:anion exchange protein 3 isoform X2 [Hyalella azteca]
MPAAAMKKSYDHEPRPMFVELCELKESTMGLEWRQTARWIKYEESVEGVHSDRWGKPHVAFLNFHAIFSLRKALDKGAVIFDMEETDLAEIVDRIVQHMIASEQIPADQKEATISTLLVRVRHVNETSFAVSRRESRTAFDADGNLITLSSVVDSGTPNSFTGHLRSSIRRSIKKARPELAGSRRHSTFEHSLTKAHTDGKFRSRLPSLARKHDTVETFNNTDLMKKLKEGTEATAVLVGAVDFLKSPSIVFVRLAESVMTDNLVEVPLPVRFIFVLLGPFHGEMDYYEVGRSISTLMSDQHFCEVAYRSHSRSQLLSAINEFLNASLVLPPADWTNTDLIPLHKIREKAQIMMKRKLTLRRKRLAAEPQVSSDQPVKHQTDVCDTDKEKVDPPRDPMKRVGKPFYGVYMDIKSRLPFYLSDFKDGLSLQVLAASIFILFASLAPAITFGGLYALKTNKKIGVGETLISTCIGGAIISLFGGQPLLIIGATGPLMVFDMALYSLADSIGEEFLVMRTWISIWQTVFVIIISAVEGVTVVKYITRFVEEIYATLVCVIFIYEAMEKLVYIFIAHPLLAEYCFGENGIMTTISSLITTMMPGMSEVVELGNMTASDREAYMFASTTEDVMQSGASDDTDMFTMNPMNMTEDYLNMTKASTASSRPKLPPQPNTALLSLLLMFCTFIIATRLKKFRNSKYLGRPIRRSLGDFGVPIAIVSMVLVDYFIKYTYTDKLTMPPGIQPSDPSFRGWIINPFGEHKPIPIWVIFMCAPASLLIFTLIFIEANISQLLISKPERNLKKGYSFHWDIVVVTICNVIAAFLGAPYMTPAVVRTLSHAAALAVLDSNVPPGESPKVVGYLEQRVSGVLVAVLVGLSIFLSPLLNLIPNSVLFGVFLYMGAVGAVGIQFLERVIHFFIPVKHHYNVPYVKEVPTWKMHLYTLVQIAVMVVLWVVKGSKVSICFPFILLCLIPIRFFVFPRIFSSKELQALDGVAPPPSDGDEPDFYEEAHNIRSPSVYEDDEGGKDLLYKESCRL